MDACVRVACDLRLYILSPRCYMLNKNIKLIDAREYKGATDTSMMPFSIEIPLIKFNIDVCNCEGTFNFDPGIPDFRGLLFSLYLRNHFYVQFFFCLVL